MSCGLHCILNDVPNLKEIIDDSNVGIVVNFTNEVEAAKKIMKYIQSVDSKKECIKSRTYAEKKLDWSIIAKSYDKIFKNRPPE